MSKVAIVTDSTAYLPPEYLEKYAVRVAPQVLIWGKETYLDGVDIQPDEFYKRLQGASVMPSTSQASPQSFIDIFTELRAQDHDILAILLSEKLSGTIASAQQALELMPGEPVEIFDSRSTAMAMGFQVLAAARAAEQGASLAECIEVARRARESTGVIFAVETLEFLHRGGRIGGASRLMGTALNIKPILEVTEEGVIEAVERVRTRKKSLSRLVELLCERVKGRTPVHLAVLHANAPEEARQLMEQAAEALDPIETILSAVSPVVGTHAGPGTVGLAYLAGM